MSRWDSDTPTSPSAASLPARAAWIPPYTFTGKEYDEEAGLYYYGARYYSPLSGRFITFDTVAGELETPISQNRYIYAWANPLRYTDPDGHVIEDLLGIGFDLFDLATSPSWWDAAFLVADIGALFIPGVPGPGTVKAGVSIAKGLKRGEKAVDAAVDVGKAVKVGKAAEEAIKSGRFQAFKSFEASRGQWALPAKAWIGTMLLNKVRLSSSGLKLSIMR